MSEQEQDTLTFEIKRSHFYAITVPLAFLLGLTVGYLSWGQADGPSQAAASDSSSGGSSLVATQAVVQPQEPQTVAEQIEALERYDDRIAIEDHDPVSGPEDAPITIIEFSDFECPFCQRHFSQVYPRLLSQYPDQIRYVYKDFPLNSIHPNARGAAIAAQCAFEQDAFWPYHDLLFGGTLGLSRSSYESYASSLDLEMETFTACLDEDRYAEVVDGDTSFAQELGISSTPTFFINGIPLVGAQPFEVFSEIIDYELARLEAE